MKRTYTNKEGAVYLRFDGDLVTVAEIAEDYAKAVVNHSWTVRARYTGIPKDKLPVSVQNRIATLLVIESCDDPHEEAIAKQSALNQRARARAQLCKGPTKTAFLGPYEPDENLARVTPKVGAVINMFWSFGEDPIFFPTLSPNDRKALLTVAKLLGKKEV